MTCDFGGPPSGSYQDSYSQNAGYSPAYKNAIIFILIVHFGVLVALFG